MVRNFPILLILFTIAFSNYGISQEKKFSYKFQISDLILVKPQSPFYFGNIIRTIPQLNLEKTFKEKYKLDAELSINGFANIEYADNKITKDSQISLYRAWVRYSTKKFELRLGLQKLNFGSAQIIRPLMWFDSVDPRDPQKITNGVYGGLFRYYFSNNANFWFWTLIGNKNLKGLEFTPTEKNYPEFGGRMQYPVKKGEISLSYNFRKTDVSSFLSLPQTSSKPENKFGMDGKIDIGVGLSLESSYSVIVLNEDSRLNTIMITIGTDYTFGIGNGVGLTFELFYFYNALSDSDSFLAQGFFPALVLTYPLTILDNISSVSMFDISNKHLYQFIGWQRTYDHFSFNIMGSLNPNSEMGKIIGFQDNNFLSGNYLQFLFSYNL